MYAASGQLSQSGRGDSSFFPWCIVYILLIDRSLLAYMFRMYHRSAQAHKHFTIRQQAWHWRADTCNAHWASKPCISKCSYTCVCSGMPAYTFIETDTCRHAYSRSHRNTSAHTHTMVRVYTHPHSHAYKWCRHNLALPRRMCTMFRLWFDAMYWDPIRQHSSVVERQSCKPKVLGLRCQGGGFRRAIAPTDSYKLTGRDDPSKGHLS